MVEKIDSMPMTVAVPTHNETVGERDATTPFP